jgi:hypothetical protein
MQSRAEPRPRSTALLTIHGQSGAWGIPSIAVAGVQRLEASSTEPPIELLSLLGVASAPRSEALDHARILVLEVAGERVSLLVHGALQLAQTSVDDLLPLPAALQTLTPLVSHLAVIDGKPALFVVSPERLLAAARRAVTAPPRDAGHAPHDSAPR